MMNLLFYSDVIGEVNYDNLNSPLPRHQIDEGGEIEWDQHADRGGPWLVMEALITGDWGMTDCLYTRVHINLHEKWNVCAYQCIYLFYFIFLISIQDKSYTNRDIDNLTCLTMICNNDV